MYELECVFKRAHHHLIEKSDRVRNLKKKSYTDIRRLLACLLASYWYHIFALSVPVFSLVMHMVNFAFAGVFLFLCKICYWKTTPSMLACCVFALRSMLCVIFYDSSELLVSLLFSNRRDVEMKITKGKCSSLVD